VKQWFNRVWVSIRGFIVWLKVGYPFVVLFAVVLGLALARGASWLHIWIILILGATLTVTEMLNYAIERLCDVVMPNEDNRIKLVKDICAGSVLVAGVALLLVGGWIIIR